MIVFWFFSEEGDEMKGNTKEELFKLLMAEIVPTREKLSFEMDSHRFPCKGSRIREELEDEWTLADCWRRNGSGIDRSLEVETDIISSFESIPLELKGMQGHTSKTLLTIRVNETVEKYDFKEFCHYFKAYGYIQKENNSQWKDLYEEMVKNGWIKGDDETEIQ